MVSYNWKVRPHVTLSFVWSQSKRVLFVSVGRVSAGKREMTTEHSGVKAVLKK